MQYIAIATERAPVCSRGAALTPIVDTWVLFICQFLLIAAEYTPQNKVWERMEAGRHWYSLKSPTLAA